MSGFVDIHTHILPGVDDGAADLQEACALVRLARQDGTRTLFLTPHNSGKGGDYSPEQLREGFAQLQAQVAAEMPDMQLHLGMEVRYDSDAPEELLRGRLLTMDGSEFVLLEFSTRATRSQILMGVTETVRYGFTPIIAHTERCESIRTNPALIDEVRSVGGYIQINADSVLGVRGFSVKRLAHRLLKTGKVDFVASDAHDPQTRPPHLRQCFLRICKKYGEEYAARVFWENAGSILRKESE